MALIHALAKKKTVILISHRLVNAAGADRIYVMEKGRVVESGKHDALLAQKGLYARLWNASRNWNSIRRKWGMQYETKRSAGHAAGWWVW